MSVLCRRIVGLSLFSLALMCVPQGSGQDVDSTGPLVPIVPNPSKLVQSVRLSLVEGDVRVSRGKQGEKATGAEWEQAEVNLPIAPGFSLATGKGRAEIEFEDASTMYLGENSAMSFGELTSKAGVTHTAIELISGTLTLNVSPGQGDWFKVRTPGGGEFTVPYPDNSLARVNRYLDATGVTLFEDTTMRMGKAPIPVVAGKMMLVRDGDVWDGTQQPRSPTSYAPWDAWVLERVEARNSSMAQVMGQSGLAKPVAGLQDLQGQGSFFDCAPYGKCWEPAKGWDQAATPSQASETVQAGSNQAGSNQAGSNQAGSNQAGSNQAASNQAASNQTVSLSALQAQQGKQMAIASTTAQSPAQPLLVEEPYFPCGPERFDLWWRLNPQTSLLQQYPVLYRNPYPWLWTVCHSGSWIRHGRRYAWVAEQRRRHHPPVRWVKVNGRVAFVPAHPRDEKGKVPINAKYGLFAVKAEGDEKHGSVERLAYDPSAQVKVLASIPKEYDKPFFPTLKAVEAPRVEARVFNDAFRSPFVLARTAGTPITFDHKSQSFVMAHQEMQGSKAVTVSQSLGGGPSAARGSGSPAVSHSGGSGGYSGGGSAAASRGSGGSGGGGSSSAASHSAPASSSAPAVSSAPASSAGSSGHPH